MNYQEMSDREISKLVFELTKIDGFVSEGIPYKFEDYRCEDCTIVNNCDIEFDPCNSWADAGPIIQENRISIFASDDEGKWMARFINYETAYMDKNPLRAAMIVFLMMKGGE